MPSDTHMPGGISVAQLGARRHYAVPRAFLAAGQLDTFYTDILLSSKVSQTLIAALGRGLHINALSRLAGRLELQLPEDKVQAFPAFGLRYRVVARYSTTDEKLTAAWLWAGKRFCELVNQHIVSQDQSVYAYTSAAKELFEKANTLGGRTYLDHATAPRKYEMGLVREEMERFPGWAPAAKQDGLLELYHQRQLEELDLADTVICASTYARQAVEEQGVAPQKIRVVPLGLESPTVDRLIPQERRERHFRVLFVGADGMRKGIGYLNQALDLIGVAKPQVRVAGDLRISGTGLKALKRNMRILGPVPRTEIKDLLGWADVLVLPSVSDTFGMVVLEALAAGVPVIATRNTCAPDIVREGVDGFVVGIRDPGAIAEKLELLSSDNSLLEELSANARERAQSFTIERYGQRLLEALY